LSPERADHEVLMDMLAKAEQKIASARTSLDAVADAAWLVDECRRLIDEADDE